MHKSSPARLHSAGQGVSARVVSFKDTVPEKTVDEKNEKKKKTLGDLIQLQN